MSLTTLPHEVQLNILERFPADYATLAAVALVSRHLKDCALELLRKCRTLDLSEGNTDSIADVLANLYEFATNNAAPGPHTSFVSSGDALGDKIIQHAARYNALKLSFKDRLGAGFDSSRINRSDMAKFEAMMMILSGDDHHDRRNWRLSFAGRRADASVRLIIHTMRHITILELGGSTVYLPWNLSGRLENLRTLKLIGITNSKLSRHCCAFAAQSSLVMLKFSKMSITPNFLSFFHNRLAISELCFTETWVSTKALTKIIKACSNLVTFEYSLSSSRWAAQPPYYQHYHLGQMLADLHPHRATLKHLTIVTKHADPSVRCNHIGSLAAFTLLESLTVNQASLTPHQPLCHVFQAGDNLQTGTQVLMRLPPSLRMLKVYRCDDVSVISCLSSIVRSMGLLDLLPGLRGLKVVYARLAQAHLAAALSQREAGLQTAFRRRGVEVGFTRPEFSGR